MPTSAIERNGRPLRIALVGGGHFGTFHAEKFSRLPGVEWVGCCDPELERARLLAQRWGASAFASLEALPDDLDAVSIAAPARFHATIASHFLERGIHLLVEKPLATTLESGRRLLDLAASTNTLIQVNHQERFFLVEWGVFARSEPCTHIEVERLGPPPVRPSDCGVVLDILIHDLDWIRALTGDESYAIEILDGERGESGMLERLHARLRSESGLTVGICGSRLSSERRRRASIQGCRGPVVVDFVGRTVEGDGVSEVTGGEVKALYGEHPFEPGDYVGKSVAHFVECIRLGRPPLTGGVAGLRALETALALEAAADCIT